MEIFAVMMLAAPFLLITVLVLLALLVKGLRRADSASLKESSANRLDTLTRRVVGGIHTATRNDEGR